MAENNGNSERCLGPIPHTENIEKLNSAIVALNGCRGKKLKNALAKVEGFSDIRVAKDIVVYGIKYWRTISFLKKEGDCVNISIPYDNGSGLERPIAIFKDSIVGIDTVEALVGRISEELTKENQI
ncbi:MAG: hypothetical protein Q8N37_01945 [bacterium]|nr:hypothetical protein [bacterium]